MSLPPGGSGSPPGSASSAPPRFISAWGTYLNTPVVPSSNTAGVLNAPVSIGTTTTSTQPKTALPVTRAVSTPHKALCTGLYRSSVILIVGTAKVQYTLHKDLLCFYSDFFRAALNGSFKEATEHRIELPEVQIDVFEAFQVWLYTQSLPRNEIVPTKVYPEWSLLVGLWIFGDGHQTPLFQNNVMDAMLAKVDEDLQVPTKVLNLAYDNTLPNSPLRKALTDIMVYRSKMPTGDNSDEIKLTPLGVLEDWPKQACLDVIAEMSRGWTNKAPRHCIPKREKCHYHVHAKDEHC